MSEVTVLNQSAGNGSLVDMASFSSATDMQRNLIEMKSKIGAVQQFVKEVMVEGLDYGVIPYTENRTLFQPGADKLNALYGFARYITAKEESKDFKSGHYDVTVRIQLRHRDTGLVVGEGEGFCATYESKYRYRWVFESDLPKGIDKDSVLSKNFKSKRSGKEYLKYRLENQDLFDVWNTVLKMAIKRAYVSATLAATGLSGIFQMDEDEFEAWVEGQEASGKEKLDKQRSAPQSTDEKATFEPPSGDANKISQSQYGKIMGDAKRKGVDEDSIKSIILYVKKKPINELSKAEASAVIKFIADTDEEGLQELILQAAVPGVAS
ncbi:hypothetical protein [Sporomusa sp. KB1]|jgi:hypothetical protein|uniref:hypothetical protein n=1 Tax=Sporomusa sp. KB1 TaxID=943346 RepID=UPI0011A56108|nr:hypothetical protein [Sporomusa sp. KB1]TWH48510.1 hypothetical protein Salpa_4673 [Sporomusa sp. KB1]